MPQSQNPSGHTETAQSAWEAAVRGRKYATLDGAALITSVFQELGKGFIAPVDAPSWFHHVPADERQFVAMAILEASQNRLGQNSDPKSAAEYTASVNDRRLNGDDSVRDKDAFDKAITAIALSRHPDATPANLKATCKTSRDNGWLEKNRDRLLAEGYPAPPKRERKADTAKALGLDD